MMIRLAVKLLKSKLLFVFTPLTSSSEFTKKFGKDPREQFEKPLATLKEWGFLTNGGDRIGVTRDGLMQIDRLLHEFFKPEHETGRYA